MKLETFEIPLRLKSAVKTVPHSSPVLEKKAFSKRRQLGRGCRAYPDQGTSSELIPARALVLGLAVVSGFLCPRDI